MRPRVQRSAEAARDFEDPVALLDIDGGHDFATVLEDFTLWFPKVVDGGVMAFHDTVGYPGPRRVVRDHVYRSRRFRRVRFADSLTYAEKVSRSTIAARRLRLNRREHPSRPCETGGCIPATGVHRARQPQRRGCLQQGSPASGEARFRIGANGATCGDILLGKRQEPA